MNPPTRAAGWCTGCHVAILAVVNADDLTPLQALKLYERLRPSFEYLAQVQKRMEERGFHSSDRLYLEVKAARDVMQLLCKDLHAIACRSFTNR